MSIIKEPALIVFVVCAFNGIVTNKRQPKNVKRFSKKINLFLNKKTMDNKNLIIYRFIYIINTISKNLFFDFILWKYYIFEVKSVMKWNYFQSVTYIIF